MWLTLSSGGAPRMIRVMLTPVKCVSSLRCSSSSKHSNRSRDHHGTEGQSRLEEPPALFGAQGNHRVDSRRATRGDEAGNE